MRLSALFFRRLQRGSWPAVAARPGGRRGWAAALTYFLGVTVLAVPQPAAAAICPPADVLPRVTLSALPGYLYYDTSRTSEQLDRLQGRRGSADRRRGWHPIGLTLTELQFRMQISVTTVGRADSTHCAVISAVDATLGYDKITVYVDRRFKPGSCQHQSVLDHEHLHLAAFRDTLAVFAPRVEQRLLDAAQRLRPVTARTPEQAAAKLQRALQREMEPMFNEMNRRLDAENAQLDNKDNYLREQSRCSTW